MSSDRILEANTPVKSNLIKKAKNTQYFFKSEDYYDSNTFDRKWIFPDIRYLDLSKTSLLTISTGSIAYFLTGSLLITTALASSGLILLILIGLIGYSVNTNPEKLNGKAVADEAERFVNTI